MSVWREFIDDVNKYNTLLKFFILKDHREDVTFVGKLISEDDHYYLIEKYRWDRSEDEYISTGRKQVIRKEVVYTIYEVNPNSEY